MSTRTVLACWVALLGMACSDEATSRRHFDNGVSLLEAQRYPEAIIELRNAVDRDERWAEARFKLAEAYAANGEPDKAHRQYIRAADLMPDNADAQLKATAYLLLAGHYEDAKTRAQRLLEFDPDNVGALIALGNALSGLRDLDGAVTPIIEAMQLDPTRSQAYSNLGRIRLAQGRSDEARAAFDRAVEIDANSVTAHLARANFQWSVGEQAAAEQSLKRVLTLDAGNVLTHRVLASVYLATGRVAEAERHLLFAAEAVKTPDAQFSLADYYLLAGRSQDAQRILRPLAALDAARAGAETRLAHIAYTESSPEEARQLLDRVVARGPAFPPALVVNARWLLNEGKAEEALEQAKAALAVNPQLIVALFLRAEAEAATGRTSEATQSLLEVLRLNPHDADAQVRLSALHLARNQVDSALHLAQEALVNEPARVDAHVALIRALIARGDITLARTEIATLKARAGSDPSVHVVDGAFHLRTGNLNAARTALERALELDRTSREAFNGLTTIDVRQGRLGSARARCQSFLERGDTDPEVLLMSAKVFLASGDPARAEQLLRQAIVADPRGTDSYALLAQILTRQNRSESARTAFEDEARQHPTSLAPRLMSALLLHTDGRVGEATERYREILKLEPRAALAANNLAAIYADSGDRLTEAQQLAQSAADQWPRHAGMRDTLGWVFFQRQLYGPAISHLQHSILLEPDNPVFHYHLGLAYAKSGESNLARQSLQKAVTLNPGFTDARRALESLD